MGRALSDATQAIADGSLQACALAAARAAWPDLEPPGEPFLAYLRERVPEADWPYVLPARVGELSIAYGCARRPAAALAAFEARYFVELDVVFAGVRGVPIKRDEFRQLIREKLFVENGNHAPRILDYTGKGSLRRWLRVVALRVLLNLATRERMMPIAPSAFDRF